VLSRWTDWDDRTTCVLFGDGAGAVVLRADQRDRLLGFELCSDGSSNHCLNLAYQPQTVPLVGDIAVQQGTFAPITMSGREVYKFAVGRVPEVIEKALFRASLTTADIDWLCCTRPTSAFSTL
jgi:3-oxoacyl-[acyl-carrier-protein] synthase-3